ncbi:MAG: sulfotransferase domain-containing protein [Pseudomonadota bacterium]
MPLPDFLIIGAMKCGTSTLAAQLAAQEGVFVTTPKEPNFFSDDAVYQNGEAWYEALFVDAAPGDRLCEASTHYTKLPTYPNTLARMQALLPAPKLIYVIRNPIARAVSHFIHDWSEGHMPLSMDEALEEMPELVEYGCYGRQIAPFIEAYGSDAVHLTSLEEIQQDPVGAFRAIAEFAELPASARWIVDLPVQNASSDRVRRLPLQGLLVDNPVARTARHLLVPKSLRNKIRESRTMSERPSFPKARRAEYEARFLDDRVQLEAVFSGHPALSLCYPFERS